MPDGAISTVAIPEPGQLVEVRQRHFVVTEVEAGSRALHSPTANPLSRVQHLVSLRSVEDDALGEELQVIWELEPGARAYEQMALPDPPASIRPRRLDAFLDAVRWGAIASADVQALQAPFRSGIDIEDYQLDPVVRALQMPRVNLLIADDVGLGKTIEAGLVVQELSSATAPGASWSSAPPRCRSSGATRCGTSSGSSSASWTAS